MKHIKFPSWIVALCLAPLFFYTSGCGGYVDLDVTIFSRLNLDTAVPESSYDIPEDQLPGPNEALRVEFSQFTEVDLSQQINESVTDQVDDIFLDSIRYRVPENNMAASLSEVALYIAPVGTPSAQHADAVHLGTIDFITAGTAIEDRAFPLTSEGHRAIQYYLMQTKFVIFITGTALARGVDSEDRASGDALIELDIVGSAHHY